MTKKIAAKYVYTLDEQGLIINGFLEYDGEGRILNIGKCDESYDGHIYEGALVPGFVNAHCHLELSHLKGKFKKGTGMAGFIDQINEMRDSSTREQKLKHIEEHFNLLWDQGVSAMADISNCSDTFSFKATIPMYTTTFLEVFGTEPEDCSNVMAAVEELRQEAKKYGLDAAPTPHSCYTMSPELLSSSSNEALKEGFLSYHSQESREEEDMIMYGTGALYENRKRAGMSTPPVTGRPSLLYFLDCLDKTGFNKFDQNILLVHNICLTSEVVDEATSKLKNVYWAICPLSNLFIHKNLPPISLMREKGLKICLGTDSLSSNDQLNIVAELYCLQENFPDVSLEEKLKWACKNGSEFLSKENQLGSFVVGKKPGIVLIENLDKDGKLTSTSYSKRIK